MVATPRRKASNQQPDSSEDDAGPSNANNGALASFVNATTSYQSKRRKIPKSRRASDADEQARQVPLAAFPRFDVEISDRPRKARRQAYFAARQWLYNTSEDASRESSHPITAEVTRVLASMTRKESRGRDKIHQSIPVVCVPDTLPASYLWSILQSSDDRSLPRALFVADHLSAQDTRHTLAAACRHWLKEIFDDRPASSMGCTALWQRLMEKFSSSDISPTLLLGLSGLPSAYLFSTLAYLRASIGFSLPRIVIVLYAAHALDGLPWEEQRHLQIHRLQHAVPQTPPLLHRLFLDLHAPPPLILPPEVLDLASRHPDPRSQIAVIDLALQRLYSSTPELAFSLPDQELHLSDFTRDFLDHTRQSLLRTIQGNDQLEEPELSFLPPILQDGKALKAILQDDEALFGAMPALVHGHISAWQDRSLAWNMLRQAPHTSVDTIAPQSLDSFTTLMITSTTAPADVTTSLTIRKGLNDLLAPLLRAIRRGENEEGGLAIAELEQWLDRLEDWAAPLQADGIPMHSEDFLAELLQSIRCFQQELYTTQSSINDLDAESAICSEEASRFTQVEKQLQRDEALRASRGRIADWFANTLRTTLLRQIPSMLFSSPTYGADLAIAIESLLFPSPRSHITIALSRPHLYLQHFADVIEASQQSSPSSAGDDDERMQSALRTLQLTLSSSSSPPSSSSSPETQTDLSRAFDLLREAGGPGTGVKGRMVNLYDWYQAWLASGGMQHDDHTQVNFSLVLSTLALMGYIRKTRKGNGEFVLKTGGWDVMPWKTLAQPAAASGSKDEDDVFSNI